MKHATARSEKSELATQFSQRLREGFVLLTLAIGFFLLIALYTYEKTDPGWSSSGITKEIANSGGRAGAWIADLLLNFFGYLSYVFPILVGFCAWLFYKENVSDRERNYRLVSLKLFGFILILVACTGFASLHLPHFYTHVPLSAGGIIGDLVSRGLTHFFNVTGTTLILLLLFLGGVTWSSGLSWFRIFSFAFNYLGSWSKRLLPKWDKPFLKIKIMLGQLVARKSHPKASLKSLEEFVEIIPQPQKAKISKPSNSRRVEPTVSMEIADFKTTSIKPEIFTTDFADPEIFTMDEAFSVKKEPARRVSKEIAKVKPRLTSSSSQSQGVPALTLLQASYGKGKTSGFSEMDLLAKSQDVEQRLQDFGVDARVVAVHPGPVITRFELQLAPGLKVSKISALAKDLARSLSVISVRIVDVIPGKTVVGLELPNEQRAIVGLREVLESSQYQDAVSPLSLALGKDIAGHPVVVDLAKMPHLLVAGTTGSGKSVGVNSMLMSILYKATPEQVRLILVDPKMLELSIYDGIPHLLTPVVTDMKDAASALRWCVAEMERRYRLMAFMGVRNLAGFNQKITEAEQRGEPIPDPFTNPTGTNDTVLKVLPFIVVIIDEFADMMMVVGKKVEQLIARIAQKARAAGIHMILATQRPSVDVITGLIKANIPTRIAFQVSSKIDSRTILDQQGAEQLLGHGDMLYLPPGSGVPTRVHGAFISDEDVHNVVNVLKQQGEPEYLVEVLTISTDSEVGIGGEEGSSDGEADPLYDQAVEFVLSTRKASISSLQRRLKIGYNRAARMIETMEHAGVVGPMENSGGREILVERVEEH